MITIKEEFLTSDKTLRAIKLGGWEAIGLWLAMKAHASSKLTDGFVAEDDIETLPGAPKRVQKLLPALVNCGSKTRGGIREAGLVERVEGGWQLHDYLDHAPSREEIEIKREKARIKKRIQRDRHRAELAQLRAASLGQSPNQSPRDTPRDTRGDSPGPSPPHVLRGRARDPQPSPAQPSPEGGGSPPPIREAKPMALDWKPSSQAVHDFCAEHRVSAKAIALATEEFVGYWTIGDGMGRPKTNWAFEWKRWMLRRLKDGDLETLERQPRRAANATKQPSIGYQSDRTTRG